MLLQRINDEDGCSFKPKTNKAMNNHVVGDLTFEERNNDFL